MSDNIKKQNFRVNKKDRSELMGHSSFLIWLTGLSGSGKSTIANAVEFELHKRGIHTYALDGDNVRHGINNNLSFSPADREENIRRIAEVSNLFIDAGIVVLGSFISPYIKSRKQIKSIVGEENFIEIYINTSLEECERRDVKGLYKKARNGEIDSFTGISAPYEAPLSPDIEIKTEEIGIEEATSLIIQYIEKKLNKK
jgi:adenylylsulfate kinase